MLNGGGQVRQQGNLSGPFNSDGKFPLMFSTISGDPPGDNLPPFRGKML
jgi:hypothetical protein